jgi:hypothetical protein
LGAIAAQVNSTRDSLAALRRDGSGLHQERRNTQAEEVGMIATPRLIDTLLRTTSACSVFA